MFSMEKRDTYLSILPLRHPAYKKRDQSETNFEGKNDEDLFTLVSALFPLLSQVLLRSCEKR